VNPAGSLFNRCREAGLPLLGDSYEFQRDLDGLYLGALKRRDEWLTPSWPFYIERFREENARIAVRFRLGAGER
jgi:hypothetical protein